LIDVGVVGDAPVVEIGSRYQLSKIRQGTNSFKHDVAMTLEEARMALDVGSTCAAAAAEDGFDIICLGELGIGNTTSAACLWSALCDLPVEISAGRGTGLDDAGLDRKRAVIAECLLKHQEVISAKNAEHILAAVGGFEIAALVGAILEGAKRRRLIVIDGFTVTVACLVAMRMDPDLNEECLIFSHVSEERGHAALLEMILAPEPLLRLNMRLGEGTGAILAVPLIRSAAAIFNSMATFASAKVSTAL
jgi:nicotinate-nucleotide--dimethylbenzimidazole phosphoribosyltransferase